MKQRNKTVPLSPRLVFMVSADGFGCSSVRRDYSTELFHIIFTLSDRPNPFPPVEFKCIPHVRSRMTGKRFSAQGIVTVHTRGSLLYLAWYPPPGHCHRSLFSCNTIHNLWQNITSWFKTLVTKCLDRLTFIIPGLMLCSSVLC